MSELTRKQIEWVRYLVDNAPNAVREIDGVSVSVLCEMALRTHDAEAERDNYRAKVQRLRGALRTAIGVSNELHSLVLAGDTYHEQANEAHARLERDCYPVHDDFALAAQEDT